VFKTTYFALHVAYACGCGWGQVQALHDFGKIGTLTFGFLIEGFQFGCCIMIILSVIFPN
jgi:hypothetical protein